ncbi:ubiquinone anaerobic biosynthesis accessory factor UbiT [Vibrio viridaestus]|uniref:Ubiquinone biosynthesis accessory factor UbiT n=1 Tax=Vibrio viridaestus TaxID=2487322 RepID=A0A3N9TI46_9VIBR|nr:SCP2 sterol-binding domain-containing protein [Vibrio viridaestus]RQW63869.1 SCP2 domain-containing protein [Vibrio viridaestus]
MIYNIQRLIVENSALFLRSPVQFIPEVVQQKIVISLLESVCREGIQEGDFDFLEGKWLKVGIDDLNLYKLISFKQGRLVVDSLSPDITPDVTFRGNLNDLVLIVGRMEDPDTLFFQRRLIIEGDTELGLEVKNILDNIDFEHLPKYIQLPIRELAEFVYKGIENPSNRISRKQNAYPY